MDVSNIFWQYVDLVATNPIDDVMDEHLFQVFDCADFLNRQMRISQEALVSLSQIENSPRGMSYDHYEGVYVFKNYRFLMQGVRHILQNLCTNEGCDNQLREKLAKLEEAILRIENQSNVRETVRSYCKVAV